MPSLLHHAYTLLEGEYVCILACSRRARKEGGGYQASSLDSAGQDKTGRDLVGVGRYCDMLEAVWID